MHIILIFLEYCCKYRSEPITHGDFLQRCKDAFTLPHLRFVDANRRFLWFNGAIASMQSLMMNHYKRTAVLMPTRCWIDADARLNRCQPACAARHNVAGAGSGSPTLFYETLFYDIPFFCQIPIVWINTIAGLELRCYKYVPRCSKSIESDFFPA